MTPKTLEELMELSPNEREEPRLECETAEFFAELDRRSAEARANPGSSIPWSEVKRKLFALDEE